VRSVVASLRTDCPAACPFAADSSEPDRPQAVQADAVTLPLRGFGLDGLIPPRFGLSKQDKDGLGAHSAPKGGPLFLHQRTHVVDRKALKSHVRTGLR